MSLIPFAAAAMVLAFPPFNVSVLVPILLQPLLAALRSLRPLFAALASYLFTVVSILAVCHWVYAGAAGVLGFQYYGVALIVALVKAIPFLLVGYLSAVLYRSYRHLWCFGTALLYICAEWFEGIGNLGFSFATIALSQMHSDYVYFIAPYFGSLGITCFVITIACYISVALCEPSRRSVKVLCVALMLVPYLVRSNRLEHAFIAKYPQVKVAIVQGRGIADLGELTLETRPGMSLVVWPENALLVSSASTFEVTIEQVKSIARSLQTVILTGVSGNDGSRVANRAVVVGKAAVRRIYLKQRLVPFAEYVFWRPLFARVFPALNQLEDFKRGSSSGDFTLDDGSRVRPLICYEGTFSQFLTGSVRNEFAVVITDDSWFSEASGPQQQLDAMRLEALSFGMPFVVSGTTGPSGLIDPNGRWRLAIPLKARGVGVVTIPIAGMTPYSILGNFNVFAIVMIVLVGLQKWSRMMSKTRAQVSLV